MNMHIFMNISGNRSIALSTKHLGIRIFRFPAFLLSLCVHAKYTSIVAACYGNDVNDAIASHV